MHGMIPSGRDGSSKRPAPICSEEAAAGFNCKDVRGPLFFGLLCRHVSPSKPWLWLMQTANLKERSAHNYASGHNMPQADVLRDLLRSPDGYKVLSWLMQCEPPQWWIDWQDAREKLLRLS